MKTFFMILGVIFALILVVLGIAGAIYIPRFVTLNREATAYIQDAVPKIVSNWNSQQLVDRATPDLLASVRTRTDLDRLFSSFSRLGSLKHLDTPTGGSVMNFFTGPSRPILANYAARAEFEKGNASIQIGLRHVNNTWRINGFHVDMNVLPPPVPNQTMQPTAVRRKSSL